MVSVYSKPLSSTIFHNKIDIIIYPQESQAYQFRSNSIVILPNLNTFSDWRKTPHLYMLWVKTH